MIAFKTGSVRSLHMLIYVVGRLEKLNVHRQSLLQVLVGQANCLEFLADQDVLSRGLWLGDEQFLQGQLVLLIAGDGIRSFSSAACCGPRCSPVPVTGKRKVGRAESIRGIVDELAQDRRPILVGRPPSPGPACAAISW